jgi:hypothetical protein
MKHNKTVISLLTLVALIVLFGTANGAYAQQRPMFSKEEVEASRRPAQPVLGCTGAITRVIDVADESLRSTTAVFGNNPGGGEGGQFDKTPVLSTTVTLTKGACMDAHVSAIIGSKQTYGFPSNLALFQVSVTRLGVTKALVGHYRTPYGFINSPAVGLEAERDVDMFAANFFQRVGTGPHDVPPGTYTVDVWWAGAPPGAPGGALGAAFVLKLYLR